MESCETIGYLKYSWKLVDEWFFDARKSAEAIIGFDEMLRYFIAKEEIQLSNANFELPIQIKKGSWEIILGLASIWWVYSYLKAVGETAWKEGLLETWPAKDVKKIFKWAIISIQWLVKVISHIKDSKNRRLEWITFRNNNTEIWIPNEKWEYLFIPKEKYDLFLEFPDRIFQKNVKLIEKERVLEIGSIDWDKIERVKITESEKHYFYQKEDENDIILPELQHGENVELEWEITRTTESTSTIGFRYNWHVLRCTPLNRTLASFKDKIISSDELHFFSKVKMTWFIDRLDKDWHFKEKKPSIRFTDIQIITEEQDNLSLF